jgi:hypothetical protein
MNVLVYQRLPVAETAMRVVAAAAMVGLAVASRDWVLGIFGAFFALGVQRAARIADAAKSLRPTLTAADRNHLGIPVERRDTVARLTAGRVLESVDVYAQPKVLAVAMNELWEKALLVPPPALATALLLAFYSATVGLLALLYMSS